MDVAVFSTKPYDQRFLDAAVAGRHALTYIDARLDRTTAVLAGKAQVVCAFVNDAVDTAALNVFAQLGVRLVVLRSAGFNNVDLAAAKHHGIRVARVPAYSPEAVSEHAVALMLSLDRHIHRAYARVRDGNFALDGLLGFNLYGRTVGIVGTGRIGQGVARIMLGFGCKVLGYDVEPSPACEAMGVVYRPLQDLLATSDIISLHCPLTPETHHLIDAAAIGVMKRGVMLINTSRGAIIDTKAVVAGLNEGRIGHLGLDVYEEEEELFFEDKSDAVIRDDVFERLLMFSNVLVTGHQGFFTVEAMTAIAETTVANIDAFERTGRPVHEVL
ncbi:2-hydroxyacid dehydrogenase [Methylobacterium sp. WL6]|uniref:2-hydroxyacid dehydrogenase n=1 Tax=Methylobacterium sp. WL6 TaxID=2603901 RepID=UPI0011CC2D0D|nr:2-hydroxyacid dehydrogenase [Methylobacterium sp. WL6]TXN72457.1 2-hydroxyacid dehydrogenase [Methylobacterium sp. WL6]